MKKTQSDKAGKRQILCPKCGSSEVRHNLFERSYLGSLLMNAICVIFFLGMGSPGVDRICRNCGHRFVA